VLSPSNYNGKTGLAVVVPITNQVKLYHLKFRFQAESKRVE